MSILLYQIIKERWKNIYSHPALDESHILWETILQAKEDIEILTSCFEQSQNQVKSQIETIQHFKDSNRSYIKAVDDIQKENEKLKSIIKQNDSVVKAIVGEETLWQNGEYESEMTKLQNNIKELEKMFWTVAKDKKIDTSHFYNVAQLIFNWGGVDE